jgi:hypothetical protein
MELENLTPFPAALYRGCIDEERIAASLVVRRTFDLVAGYLVRASEEVWPVSGGPWDTPAGPMAGDDLFYRGGVDLFAFGSARSAKPVPRVDVIVEAGKEFKYGVAVFGDRVWTKAADGSLVPGAPKPFTDMLLTLANAYGGADEWDELPVPYPPNPIGKGYALSAESAIGKALPNIENPKALIRKFGEHPEPVGVCSPPYPYAPRVPRTVEFYPNGIMKKLDPKFFNAAFPEMVVPKLGIGDRVKISGMSERPIAFEVPPPDVQMRLQLGDKIHTVIPAVDQVGVEVGRERVFVTYRHAFRYTVVMYAKRRCELIPTAGIPEAMR